MVVFGNVCSAAVATVRAVSSASSGELSGDAGSIRAPLTSPSSDRQYRCIEAETGVRPRNRISAAGTPEEVHERIVGVLEGAGEPRSIPR